MYGYQTRAQGDGCYCIEYQLWLLVVILFCTLDVMILIYDHYKYRLLNVRFSWLSDN